MYRIFLYFCTDMKYKWFILLLLVAASAVAQNPKREFRGAWIQSVNGQFQGMERDPLPVEEIPGNQHRPDALLPGIAGQPHEAVEQLQAPVSRLIP